jgi:hypothetical protein
MMGSGRPDAVAEGVAGVITEPEMESGHEPAATDLLTSGDRPPRQGRTGGPQQWRWALGGAAVACAVGAAALHIAGLPRHHPPDLHGYHLPSSLCTGRNLQPLTDALAAEGLTSDPGTTRHGAALDHAACTLYGSAPASGGRRTVYTVSVTVDLHRTTDPRAEFEDAVHVAAAGPVPGAPDSLRLAGDGAVIRPFPGLGDLAFLTTSRSYQSLSVLRGGAVLTLAVVAENEWEPAGGTPASAGSSLGRPPLADTTRLRPVLPGTVRNLMGVLSG